MKYYYRETTGEFAYACDKDIIKTNLPYIEREVGWNWSDYRVDIETGLLLYEPKPLNPRIR